MAATTVTQSVQCTMANSSTQQATLTLSDSDGSTPSPSTILCNGSPQSVTVDASTLLTASEPSATPPTRFVFAGAVTALSFSVCSSGTCASAWSFSNYFQWQISASYSLVGGGSPTPPEFACQSGGSPSSAFLTQSAASIWADNGCSWTVTPNPLTGSGSTERWETQSATSGVIAGSQTVAPVFYSQYDYSVSFTVIGGGAPSSPSLTGRSFGSSASYTLTSSPQDYWLDSGSTWSVSNPAPGSSSTEQWAVQGASSGTVTGSTSMAVNYYHQYSIAFSYSVTGGGTAYSPPVLSYKTLGNGAQVTLSTAAVSYWVDAGSSWSATSQLTGSSTTEAWSAKTGSGTANSAVAIALAYYHQYLLSTSFSVSGGGAYSQPNLSYTSLGAASSSQLSQGPFWADAGSSWSADNPLAGSTASERWVTNGTTSGVVSSSLSLMLDYFHQYYVTFGFGVYDGGTGYSSPTVSVSQFGSQVTESFGWADSGSKYSFTNPLNGSSSTQRWYSGSAQGVVSRSTTINASFYHQYDFVLSYSVTGVSPQAPPRLNATSLGAPFRVALQTSATDYWLDSGSSWALSKLLLGSSSSERWMTDAPTAGKVSSSVNNVFHFYDQYPGGFTYSIQGGGSAPAPFLNYSSFGTIVSSALNSTKVVYWLDTGSSWTLTNPDVAPSGTERWIAQQGTLGTAVGPFNEAPVYAHQYLLTVEPNVAAGGSLEVSTGWHDSGSTAPINATASPGWSFSGWSGTGNGSYTGPTAAKTVSFGSAINETAVFYAGLSMNAGSGGFVEYRYDQGNGTVASGSNMTVYVLPGTRVNLTSTPSTVEYTFAGWSGRIKGTGQNQTLTVSVPVSVSAAFSLDYTDLGAFYAIAIVVMVISAYVFVIRRRHSIFGSRQLSPPMK